MSKLWRLILSLFLLGTCSRGAQILSYADLPPNLPSYALELAKQRKLLSPPSDFDKALNIVKKIYASKLEGWWTDLHWDEPVRVFWVSGRLKRNIDGTGVKEYYGLHYSSTEMYVSWFAGSKLSTSSFAHELAHCYAKLVLGDADRYHQNNFLWDDLVVTANKSLAKAGL